MSRTANGFTGQALLAMVQVAKENGGFSPQELAIKCGYVTAKGTARVLQYKLAVADANGIYFGKTIPGDVPAQRSGTTNRFKSQKNGIVVAPKRFLTEAGVAAGTYANIMVAKVEGGVIDVAAFDLSEGTKVVIITKNLDPVIDGEDSEDEAQSLSPTFIPDPLNPTPVPTTTTVRIAQPV